ncbi:MAG: NAD-dependent epimerase/dehydratase family protein [Sphingosinicella sp.]|uniref:NAD-dependent epimerase/dehydratase family protein n=1 Tax=Sphingosinicella sp. TaxID=1917971 RepID=UPI004037E443
MKKVVVTGGGGFIGAYLARRLLQDGWSVTVVDNLARGRVARLADVIAEIDWQQIDVRDIDSMVSAAKGAEVIFHLAAVNGTENFYNHPDLVLDVGIRGAITAIEAAARCGVPDVVMASSAEVYQTPPVVPTDEMVPLMLPDSLNPRYSYGGSKIITELVAFNYHREAFRKVQIFRPHNVYGPDMGWKHVLPQFIMRAIDAVRAPTTSDIPFPIQGDGLETRAFCYVDDLVDGLLLMQRQGEHRNIYHIGNPEIVTIAETVRLLGKIFGRDFVIIPSAAAEGGTRVRCPSIDKMAALGYAPKISLLEGLRRTSAWYLANERPALEGSLL